MSRQTKSPIKEFPKVYKDAPWVYIIMPIAPEPGHGKWGLFHSSDNMNREGTYDTVEEAEGAVYDDLFNSAITMSYRIIFQDRDTEGRLYTTKTLTGRYTEKGLVSE